MTTFSSKQKSASRCQESMKNGSYHQCCYPKSKDTSKEVLEHHYQSIILDNLKEQNAPIPFPLLRTSFLRTANDSSAQGST